MDENKFSNQDENWLTDRKKLSVESHFGPQTKKFYWLILTNPRRYFSGDYISATRGCCTLKFFNALEIDQGYLAHTQAGTGSPPQKF